VTCYTKQKGGNTVSTITFDTLKFAERLEKAGATREYAKAEAEALAEVFAGGTQDLATKADLRELELRVVKWVVGVAFAQMALLVGILVKLL